jgi:hypothetical protein
MRSAIVLVFIVIGWLGGSRASAARGAEAEWVAFDPAADGFEESAIDLRFLNERFAGEHGFIAAREGRFVHSATGQPVRFWAVNGPPRGLDAEALRRCARSLAKRGVNLVRIHGAVFDRDGEVDLEKVRHAQQVVSAMKAEGIYVHLSIYFPLWFRPRADHPWLEGYDGRSHPFAALFFHSRFQEKYRDWWRALLTTPDPATGETLIDEPAVFGLELQNEDSFFFWTFSERNLPDVQWQRLERQFGEWLARRHGSIEAALAAWGGPRLKRDAPAEGRVGFRPLWNIFNERTLRDQETAAFLLEVQTGFYAGQTRFLRELGFRGLIHASNWSTASPEIFGPLEKLSYLPGDFMDRHGYFSCNHKGEFAEWSIREGHTYSDRSALRFEADDPTRPRQFVHPVMDPAYDGRPSMISETTFTRPNRYRSEAPIYYAAYGALQDTDAVVHFALDGDRWAVKPQFWMQPWTLMSPAMMGQFPATALLYRRGLIATGDLVTEVRLNRADLLALRGTPLPQEAALDELRLKDVPRDGGVRPGQRLDPLLHYVGRSAVRFTDKPGGVDLTDLRSLIDHAGQTVTSSTRELRLDYGRGVLVLNAPGAQGVSGALRAAGRLDLRDLTLESPLELGHLLVVPLDDRPVASSRRLLLQVMSEEQASGFEIEPVSDSVQRIVRLGRDPWMIRRLAGTVRFSRADAAQLRVTALDPNGYAEAQLGDAREIRLRPHTIYYLIEPSGGDERNDLSQSVR